MCQSHRRSRSLVFNSTRAHTWILYGPSEQSRWAPQLGQRSWQACMSIIVCPHMGHSFFLPTAIHHAQDPLHITHTDRYGSCGSCHPAHARSCARVATCLPGSLTHAVATTPRSSGTKICTKCKPLTFAHIGENDPRLNSTGWDVEKGPKQAAYGM